ncbi:nuclear transport factor 2 family protein [Mucilaginibacter agri]|uniref:Nuclear transport factor 2 family protein n=1 Tax=Mucilaginibacter agri TaxID=2695265 RepID=A0A965ZF50_9SPHI|nr:nuclear transport factor 2 family protein [Mucilaginibacter agri]NCD69765.1 nuclear transport factor 2 family protein [Mucilaginibacter agri]
MKTEIPTIIAAYITASNAKDISTVASLFAKDAVVKDEGAKYAGVEEIVNWQTKIHKAYDFRMEAKQIIEIENGFVVTTTLSGSFPGKNPIDVDQRFKINNGLIAELEIK